MALGNVLVATGTLVLSASGSFAGRFGKDRAFAVTLLVGLCILFSGFLVASNSSRMNSKDDSAFRDGLNIQRITSEAIPAAKMTKNNNAIARVVAGRMISRLTSRTYFY